MEVLQGVPGQIVGAHLAVPDRHQHLPDLAGGPSSAGRCPPGWVRRARTRPASSRNARGAVAGAAAGCERRPHRPFDDRRIARVGAAGVRRRAAAPVPAPAGRAGVCATCCSGRPPRWPTRSAPPPPRSTACCSGPEHNSTRSAPVRTTSSPRPIRRRPRICSHRYIAAFEAYDIDRLVELFTEEAFWEMPPFDGWYQGPAAIAALIQTHCPAEKARRHAAPPDRPPTASPPPRCTCVNNETGAHEAFQLHVLDDPPRRRVACGGVSRRTRAVREFGLPASL